MGGSLHLLLQPVPDVLRQQVGLVGVEVHDNGLEGLEVGNRGPISASEELPAVLGETGLKDGDDLVPEVCEPGVEMIWVECCGTAKHRQVQSSVRALLVFHEVNQGIDLPAGHWVIGVVSMTHAEHSEDSTRLDHREAILNPDWHSAERQFARRLLLAELFGFKAIVYVLDTSVMKQRADSAGAAIDLEVEELGWNGKFGASVELCLEHGWSVSVCSDLVMGTCEVLLHVGTAAHALVESLEVRMRHEGLVSQMNGIVNVRHENEICNAWLGAQKVKSAIFEQLTDSVKGVNAFGNTLNAVKLALRGLHHPWNKRIICNSLELMAPCFILRSGSDELWAVLLGAIVVNSVSF